MTAIELETFSHVDSEEVENCCLRKQAAILPTSYLSFTKRHRLHWQILFSPFFSSALSFSQVLLKCAHPKGFHSLLSLFPVHKPWRITKDSAMAIWIWNGDYEKKKKTCLTVRGQRDRADEPAINESSPSNWKKATKNMKQHDPLRDRPMNVSLHLKNSRRNV